MVARPRAWRALLVALLAIGCARPRGPADAPAMPPAHQALAVIAHERDEELTRYRVALLDLDAPGAPLQWLSPPVQHAASPTWSQNGAVLGFVREDALWIHELASGTTRALPVTLAVPVVFALSPDGRAVAVAQRDGVLWQDVREGATPRTAAVDGACEVRDLQWSQDGRTIAALCRDDADPASARVVFVDAGTGRSALHEVPDAVDLLGQRPGGAWLLRCSGEVGRTLVDVSAAGAQHLVSTLDDEQYVTGYVPARDALILVGSSEDLYDPVALSLAAPGQDARPWLRSFPRLADLSITPDGNWATFVNRPPASAERPGGDIYVVRVGQDDARLVLKANAQHSFFQPALQPVPSGRTKPPAAHP